VGQPASDEVRDAGPVVPHHAVLRRQRPATTERF
jgi:hypothetical protein